MKVSGFTIIRNAINYDYPVVEAVESILPLCNELVVAVGKADDETLELIKSIKTDKIRIIETVWDDSLRDGGKVLAVETDKAFRAIAAESDWGIYIQADECIHEQYIEPIKNAMELYKDDDNVDGLLLKYLHFYGSYNYVGDSRQWYRREIRVVKNDRQISSYRDAQGFRKSGNKLKVKLIDAWVYHYGWVKSPEKQQDKQQNFNKMWHEDQWIEKKVGDASQFDYSNIDSLSIFKGTHPKYIQPRINQMNWTFDFDPSRKKMGLKNWFLHQIEKVTNYRLGEYKNYKIIN